MDSFLLTFLRWESFLPGRKLCQHDWTWWWFTQFPSQSYYPGLQIILCSMALISWKSGLVATLTDISHITSLLTDASSSFNFALIQCTLGFFTLQDGYYSSKEHFSCWMVVLWNLGLGCHCSVSALVMISVSFLPHGNSCWKIPRWFLLKMKVKGKELCYQASVFQVIKKTFKIFKPLFYNFNKFVPNLK